MHACMRHRMHTIWDGMGAHVCIREGAVLCAYK
jgi:hypothetical protein